MMRFIGPGGVASFQEAGRAYCVFNPYVEVEGTLLKYGVISEKHLYNGEL